MLSRRAVDFEWSRIAAAGILTPIAKVDLSLLRQ